MNNIFIFSKRRLYLIAIFGVLLVAYYFIFVEPFFPNQSGGLGHDYEMWFPRMLAGVYYFVTNGFTVIPWFTPSCCGSTVLFANPQDLFFSVPQFLNFFFDPIVSIKLTFMLFATLGLCGTYLLLRHTFALQEGTAIFGASLFLFNGFFAYRMIIGHLGYHSFMLLPLISYFLLQILTTSNRIKELAMSVIAALLYSYVFYSGGVHLLLPIALAVLAVFIAAGINHRPLRYPVYRAGVVVILTLLICAAKLHVALSTLGNFNRDYYPLPGIDNIFYAIWVPIKSLFFSAYTWVDTNRIFTNLQWTIQRHELELSLSFIPLALMLWGLANCFRGKLKINKKQCLFLLSLLIICLVPLAINFYTPGWNLLLKQIPIIKNSAMLVRWYAIYIPLVVICAAVVIDKLKFNRYLVPGLILLLLFVKAYEDKTYYAQQGYNPQLAVYAHQQVMQTHTVPAIAEISSATSITTAEGTKMNGRDEIMAFGLSQINCHESLFGYRHEEFKQKELLQVGQSVTQLTDGRFNMKNPACYVFPSENNCIPGDHFLADQKEELLSFISYKGYLFSKPKTQHISNWLSLITFLMCGGFLLLCCLQGVRVSYRQQS